MSKYTCIVNQTRTYTLHVAAESEDDAIAIVTRKVERSADTMDCDESDIHVSCVMGDMPEHYGINAYNVTEDLLHDVAKDEE